MLLSSYIIVLFLPFLASASVYNRAVNIMNKNAIKFSTDNLNNISNLMEKEISYVDQFILELSIKPELRRIINLNYPTEGSSDMYLFYEFYRLFNNMGFKSNNNKDKVFLLINTNKSVYGQKYVTFSFEDFYEQYFTYEGMDYEQWYDMYFNRVHYQNSLPEKNIKINNTNGNYITCLYTLPVIQSNNDREKKEGVIAYLFDANEIKEMLEGTVVASGGWAYILDKNNQVLLSTDETNQNLSESITINGEGYQSINIEGKEMMVVCTQLPHISWKFVSIIPLAAVKSELNQFRYVSFGILAVTILFGLLFAFYLSYRNTKPIRTLITLLPSISMTKRNNELLLVENGIKGLIVDNDKMKESLLQQCNYLKMLYFEKLLRGDIQNIKDFEIIQKYIGVHLSGAHFVVMLIRINLMDQLVNEEILLEQNVSRAFLDKALLKASGERGYTHIINTNELAYILSFEKNEECDNLLKDIIQKVSSVFVANFMIKPIFAIGNNYSDILDLHYSLKEARYAADYLVSANMENLVVWYKDLEHISEQYYYSREIEQKISNFTKLGQWDELKKLLSKIYLNSIGNKNMSNQMNEVILADLCATLIKISNEIKIDVDIPLIEKVVSTEDYEQYFKTLKLEYKKICNELSKNKKSHNEKLKDHIIEYIQKNFRDSNLSVVNLSNEFNLSEAYFSQFFKEQTKETFSHYLERLRLEHASCLLVQQKMSIEEISKSSGYNSTNTFRRAFKRVIGISPTEYINTIQK